MPLPYNFFVKTTRIVGNPSDANDGRDPLGCNLSGAGYDHTGGASGERQLTAASGTPFTNVQANDYIYLDDTGSGVTTGLYQVKQVISTTVLLLFDDVGLTGDSASGISSSNGPLLTLQAGLDKFGRAYQRLVICADGGGTDSAWELTTPTLDVDTFDKVEIQGGNSRGVVDGTRPVIDGSGMNPSENMFTCATTQDGTGWSDLRFTGAIAAAFYANDTATNYRFYRCRFDNCGTSAIVGRQLDTWGYYDCEFDSNTEYALDYSAATDDYGGGNFVRCRIHDNGSGGLRGRGVFRLVSTLVYDNSGIGLDMERVASYYLHPPAEVVGCVFHGNSGSGISHTGNYSSYAHAQVSNCIFSDNGGYGLDGTYQFGWLKEARGCLFHNNTSGAINFDNVWGNYTHSTNGAEWSGISSGLPWADDNIWIEFTGGSYDDTGHSDGDYRLESTGSFADVRPNQTALINLTDSGNITAGLYTIATKISDDVVLLSKSAGSDSTGNVTADNDPGFTNETDGSENFRPLQNVLATKIGLEVEVR